MTQTSYVTCSEIHFQSGGYRLVGDLHLPPAYRPPLIIGSHGLFSTRRSPKQEALARRCADAGMAFFRFDHRGCGDSAGEADQVVSFSGRCHDLNNALKMLRSFAGLGSKIGLFGSSMGGAVCLGVASQLKPDALVVYAAPIRSRDLAGNAHVRQDDAEDSGAEHRPRLELDITDRLPDIRNILIVHGDADEVVPVSHSWEIFNTVKDPKQLMIQEGGDHRMSRTDHQSAFADDVVAWFRTCFGLG